jgi:hypothetical protein
MEEKSVECAELHLASRIYYTQIKNKIKSLNSSQNKTFLSFFVVKLVAVVECTEVALNGQLSIHNRVL